MCAIILSWIRQLFWKKEKISSVDVRKSIKECLNPYQLYMADREYTGYSMAKVKEILLLDTTDKRKYFSEIYDCDDFAATLYGHMKEGYGNVTIGLAWVFWEDKTGAHGHAVNVYYCPEDDITYIIEPQNDTIFQKPKHWEVIFVIM